MAAPMRKVALRSSFQNLFKTGRFPNKSIQYDHYRLLSTAQLQREKWHLYSAVCLERTPVTTPPLTEMERRYFEHLQRLEVENSILSDHEIRHLKDLERAERKKKGEEDEGEQNIQTALDVEDLWEHELQAFESAPSLTDADKTDDRKSLERKLDHKLILIVKQQLGEKAQWVLPQRQWDEEPSLREVAEKSLSSCGESLGAMFLGNAPSGFYKYRYGKEKNGHIGAKVFFFKAHHTSGEVKPVDKNIKDYLWVTRDEIKDYIQERYNRELNKFIMEL